MEGLSAVASLVGNNRERQIDLIKSMLTHLGSVDDKDNNASCEADASLVRSLRSSIATLKERNVGRMRLNDMRYREDRYTDLLAEMGRGLMESLKIVNWSLTLFSQKI